MNHQMSLLLVILTLRILSSIPLATAQHVGIRAFSDPVYIPGNPIRVQIEIAGVEANVTVVEIPPAGWEIQNILNGGKLENGVITWNLPYFYAFQSLKYTITPPLSARGDFAFTGNVKSQEIGGRLILPAYTAPIQQRSISSPVYFPNELRKVQIQIIHPPGPILVRETPPPGLGISSINNGGILDNGVITWDLPDFAGSTVLQYSIRTSQAPTGELWFSGEAGGQSITGQTVLVPYREPEPGDHNGQTALTVASVCMNVKEDKEANLKVFEEYIARASEQGAHLVVLPEIGLQNNPAWGPASYKPSAEEMVYIQDTAETVPGPSTSHIIAMARQYGIYVVFGLTEVSSGTLFNTSVVVGPEGVVGKHRKTHLWDKSYGGNEDQVWSTEPGIGVVESPLGRVGLLICIEMGLDYCQALVQAGQADFLVALTIWFDEGYVIADAQKTNRWLVVSDHKGKSGHATGFGLGHSCVVHPNGRILADTNGSEGLVVVRTDLWVDSDQLPIQEAAGVGDWQIYR